MTWPEIKSTLVRRWPDKFAEAEHGLWRDVNTDDEWYIPDEYQTLSSIAAICDEIGAVVWSTPGIEYPNMWSGRYKFGGAYRATQIVFQSREAAELAALGEWLKATEVDE